MAPPAVVTQLVQRFAEHRDEYRSGKYNEAQLRLLQALLASRLVSAYYYLKLTGEGVRTGGGFHTYPKTIRELPVFSVARAGARERKVLAEVARAVSRMYKLREGLESASSAHQKTVLQRQIETTDRQIDQLVYELYGLTDEEIKIVEEATA